MWYSNVYVHMIRFYTYICYIQTRSLYFKLYFQWESRKKTTLLNYLYTDIYTLKYKTSYYILYVQFVLDVDQPIEMYFQEVECARYTAVSFKSGVYAIHVQCAYIIRQQDQFKKQTERVLLNRYACLLNFVHILYYIASISQKCSVLKKLFKIIYTELLLDIVIVSFSRCILFSKRPNCNNYILQHILFNYCIIKWKQFQ